ncbi:MAG TPA: lipocalin-like domain-containing protein [Verrucomicrobiae bacterium]|nr:lipocalin-like domain-containing protein [Verrucomicrobiae bacterium]
MKKRLSLGVLLFYFAMPALFGLPPRVQSPAAGEPSQERFIGAWRLVSLEQVDAGGKMHDAECTGQLVFTSDGHISVQVMYLNPQNDTQAGAAQYVRGGYEASFGTYRVDERTQTFTYHVNGALVRTLIGKDLPRLYKFSGDRLVVKSARPDEHWQVTWEHD